MCKVKKIYHRDIKPDNILIYKDEKYSLLINKNTMDILKNEEELIELIKSKFA